MAQDRKEYFKAYNQAHKEERKAWYQANKEEKKEYMRAYREAHNEEQKEYQKADVNSLGQTKHSIRCKSQRYLKKHGTKIPGYEVHHCCTYNEPYKFIYCSKDKHQQIHAYLRQHNIESDTDHYEQIKHLLDDKVVLYGL